MISKKHDYRGFKVGDYFQLIGCTLIFRCVKLSHAAQSIPCVTGHTLDGERQTTARALDVVRPSAGEVAYELDCLAKPTYHDGTERRQWYQLCDIARYSWEKDPTPRTWTKAA